VTLSAAITVIFASALGLPVSSTHIAIGALFGVGFLREFMANRRGDSDLEVPLLAVSGEAPEKARRRYLVRRSHLLTIIAAWLITVPVSAGVAALIALALAKIGLPGP
jgi:inorganic phosphate transporter, PiT family